MVVMVGSNMMGELWVMVGCGGGMGFVFFFLNCSRQVVVQLI